LDYACIGKHEAPFNAFLVLCQSFCGKDNSPAGIFKQPDFLLTRAVKYYIKTPTFISIGIFFVVV
jgi:hypothetical protein